MIYLCSLFRVFILIVCCCANLFVFAQKNDSTLIHSPDSAHIWNVIKPLSYSNAQNYSPLFEKNIDFFCNDVFLLKPLSISNGNAGSHSQSFVNFYQQNEYFSLSPGYQYAQFTQNNIPIASSDVPASSIAYAMGYKREQLFRFFHTQKLDSSFSISVNYHLINSPGLYLNQRSDHSHVYGYILYNPIDKRLNLMAGAVHNKVFQKENAGISRTEQFEDSVFYDRQFTEVNLYTAESRMKNYEVFGKSDFRLNSDSAQNKFFIGYEYTFSHRYRLFTDSEPLNPYYPNLFTDSVLTLDSIGIRYQTHGLSLRNYAFSDSLSQKISFSLSFLFNTVVVSDPAANNTFQKKLISASIGYALSHQLKISANGAYNMGNFNNENYFFQCGLSYSSDSAFVRNAAFNFSASVQQPIRVFEHFFSNHFIWDRSFVDEKLLNADVVIDTKAGKIYAGFLNVNNLVFLNESSLPIQRIESETLFQMNWDKTFYLGRWVFSTVLGTNLLSDSSVIRLPEYYGIMRIGYGFPMFKKALNVFVGSEVFGFSKFYADLWNPVVGMFYRQNHTEIGDFLYPNVFLAIQVKRARIFVMMENVSSGLMEFNYYAMPGYPRNDRFFRWGINWTFFN